jgi:transcriptional regulator with PAS, ATPase and Fis domain
MPTVKLSTDAEQVLVNYYWPGNIRQLKNIAEQISIIEKTREINADTLLKYLPQYSSNNVPTVRADYAGGLDANDREIIFKVLRDTRSEINDLKKIVYDLVSSNGAGINNENVKILNRSYTDETQNGNGNITIHAPGAHNTPPQVIEVEETLSLQDKEIDMIKKALRKHKGKRKNAARELGISERTLYRKINEYSIEE